MFHVRSASESGGAKKSREKAAARREVLTVLYVLLALVLTPLVYYIFFDLPPKFSIQVNGDGTQGLDTAPLLSTVFNMTLHASNLHGPRRCYRHGEAVVLYAGFTLGTGRTRVFCVGAKDALDVPVVAWADGVTLPKSLHDCMAAEQSAGSVDLAIDVKLIYMDASGEGSLTRMWCKVTTRGAKPSDVTPCRVFALQNWASDIAPRWIQ